MASEDFLKIKIHPENPEDVFEGIESAGTGNYGVVIKARDKRTGDIVAIKQILLTAKEELSTIEKEVVILEKCDHPNIVKYYGTYRSLGKLWLVMEYCEGGSVDLVHKFLKKPLPEKLIAYVCREVLLGLQYLHKHRLIHRDIKGSNVLLTRDGQVKLADFGVSTQLENTWSRRNTFIGTVLWMAPEAIVEDEYSYKADIWSLGITVIEMAENGPPYPNATIPRLLTLIPKSDPPTLQHKEQWSPQMSLFIKRLLTKEKNARPSATEMLDDPFVATDGVGTREELQSVVEEVLEVRENMSSARVRRGEYSSDATTATFVERGTAGGKNLSSSNSNASPFTAETHQEMEPGFFSDGTVPQLPLLTCSDLSFDELVAGEERGKMSAGEVAAMLYGPAHEGVCSQEPAATLKTTETLQNVYAFNRVRPIEMGLTSKEGQETVRSRQKYGIFLRQIYKI